MFDAAVVIPNLDGGDALQLAVESLSRQEHQLLVVIVDNGSKDGSAEKAHAAHPETVVLKNKTNLGYAGGVNTGIRWALRAGFKYVGVFNDDAVAESGWSAALLGELEADAKVAVATGKILDDSGLRFDSAGDCITTWGLAIPRGRGQTDKGQYDTAEEVFAASGAASIFRSVALLEVGLFDEDFFAYFEDIDLSFRLRLAGWRVMYCPQARARHSIGMTSARTHGFTTRQTMQNMPVMLFKNMPTASLIRVLPRFALANSLLTAWAIRRGQGRAAFSGWKGGIALIWRKRSLRRSIQSSRVIDAGVVESFMVPDFPAYRPDLELIRRSWIKLLFIPKAGWRGIRRRV